MPSCYVCSRTLNNTSRSQNISFHKFPVGIPSIREKWNNFVLENNLSINNITKNSILCSTHFHPSSFLDNNKGLKLLKKNAIPTLIVVRVKNTRNIYPEIVVSGQEQSNLVKLEKKNLRFNIERKLVKISTSIVDVEGIFPLKISYSEADTSNDNLQATAELEQSFNLNNSTTLKDQEVYEELEQSSNSVNFKDQEAYEAFEQSSNSVILKVISKFLSNMFLNFFMCFMIFMLHVYMVDGWNLAH